jgi:hypothetical protein
VVGIASTSVAAGSPVDVLYHGRLAGYDLSGVDPGDTIYLSKATAGALADAAATGTDAAVVPIGRVFTMTDPDATKFLFVDISFGFVPVALA